ncbi:MAG: T9SS type A sorting domain-containing protein [Candidatus Zixiibacteriota bacterium]|nr:MAG: T9SS type A sorting domain-containing protein [candidate division Zixibacteria bacterium]
MMYSIKGLLYFFSLTMIALLTAIAPAGAMIVYDTDSLHYKLSSDTVWMPKTNDSPDTVAVITFYLYFDEDYLDDHGITDSITNIKAEFTYNSDSLSLDTFYLDPNNWNGNIDTVYEISGDTARIRIVLDAGKVPPPTEWTSFAILHFKPNCQSTQNTIPLELDSLGFNEVIILNTYVPKDFTNGEVTFGDYEASFTIAELSVTGGLGDTVSVPVYWTNNFYALRLHNTIVYDTTLLEFDAFYVANESDWDWWNLCSARKDSLIISLQNPPDSSAGIYPDSTELYYLRFILRYEDAAWEDSSTQLTFVSDSTLMATNACNPDYYVIEPNYTHTNGSITILLYTADLKIAYTDSVICSGDNSATFMVQMKHTFAAGDTADAMIVNLSLGDLVETAVFDDSPSDTSVKFGVHTYEPGGGGFQKSVRQEYDNTGLDNYWPTHEEYTGLFGFEITIDNEYTPSFDNRFIPIEFITTYSGDDTDAQIYDTTGSVPCNDSTGRLSTISDTLEIMIGEFSTGDGVHGKSNTYQEIFIRNTFNVDSFTVTVHISGDNFMIDYVGTDGDVNVTNLSDDSCTLYCDSGDGPPANGEDYTRIACIGYKFSGSCIPSQTYYDSVWFTGYSMEDSNGNDAYILLDATEIGALCGSLFSIFCPIMPGSPKFTEVPEQTTTSILPQEFALHANRPNPFNPTTYIAYDVPTASHVTIDVINILGRRVITLVNEEKAPGRYETVWNGTDENGTRVSSGIYLYKMQAGDFIQTKKMMLMK